MKARDRGIAALAAVTALFLSPSLHGQGALTGTVRDSAGRPLAGVEVVLEDSDRQTQTDQSGRYLLGNLPLGAHSALFRLVGYRPIRLHVQLTRADTIRTDLQMLRSEVQELEPVEVTARPPRPRGIGREGFEERRALGFGRFFDSTDMRKAEHRRLSDVLQGVRGLSVVRYRDCTTPPGGRRLCGPVEMRAAGARGQVATFRGRGSEYCWMSIVLDGAVLYSSGSLSPPPDLSRDLHPAELDAVEVYTSSAQVPQEFGGAAAACGVILLWSRRR
jgi:hypothetical protein